MSTRSLFDKPDFQTFPIFHMWWRIQRCMSFGQAIPLLGLAISVLKCGFGVLQVLWGIVHCGVCAIPASICSDSNEFWSDHALEGALIMGAGGVAISYSLINFCTLGCLGFVIEFLWSGSSREG